VIVEPLGVAVAPSVVSGTGICAGGQVVNWDHIEGKWQQLRGSVREQWGKLTDDDVDVIAGKRDQLIGLLQQRYGTARDEIERQVRDFENRYANVR
jgi:uncharacterized protein YjbJ (UPF0337 family)